MVTTPKNLSDWIETHCEVVAYLTEHADDETSMAYKAREDGGLGELYTLSQDLTDEFEELYENHEWDGDFLDKIDEFLKNKENEY